MEVTLALPEVANAGSVTAKHPPGASSDGKTTDDGRRGYGGNRTLTLSRHNPSYRGRRAFCSSPGCGGKRGGVA